MNCEELLQMLNDYVDGEIDPAVCTEFETHLQGCNPCQIVVDTIRKTITLYQNERMYELPIAFRQKMHTTLREKWKETHPS